MKMMSSTSITSTSGNDVDLARASARRRAALMTTAGIWRRCDDFGHLR